LPWELLYTDDVVLVAESIWCEVEGTQQCTNKVDHFSDELSDVERTGSGCVLSVGRVLDVTQCSVEVLVEGP